MPRTCAPKKIVDPGPRPDTSVPHETRLKRWMEANKVGVMKLYNATGIDPRALRRLMNGQMMPGLVTAFKIEQATAGEVPVVSWLATDLGRWAWGRHVDWAWLEEQMRKQGRWLKKYNRVTQRPAALLRHIGVEVHGG